MKAFLPFFLLVLVTTGYRCQVDEKKENDANTWGDYPPVEVYGSMRAVMWEGQLDGAVFLDTLDRSGLNGVGPAAYLQGEVMVKDGIAYRSRVAGDTGMVVTKTFDIRPPFFVAIRVPSWSVHELPAYVQDLPSLEQWLDTTFPGTKPFAFQLEGEIKKATIHVQNLPPGTSVSSPKEAHQGQVNFECTAQPVSMVGVYSTAHQGIFTHHDTHIHVHLLTADATAMGHADKVMWSAGAMRIKLPAGLL